MNDQTKTNKEIFEEMAKKITEKLGSYEYKNSDLEIADKIWKMLMQKVL